MRYSVLRILCRIIAVKAEASGFLSPQGLAFSVSPSSPHTSFLIQFLHLTKSLWHADASVKPD